MLFRRTLKSQLAGALYENELLLENAKVVVEELEHRLACARSHADTLAKRCDRQRGELLVIEGQEIAARTIDEATKPKLVVNHG